MKTLKISSLLLILALPAPLLADTTTPSTNVLMNGGFENWQPVSPEDKDKPDSTVKAGWIASGYWFNSEAYERGQDPKFPITVSISKDDAIKHGGQSAVRLVNAATTDIGSVALQPVTITPNTHYVLKGWMKGEIIVLDAKTGTGICIWTNIGPEKDFWGKMTNDLRAVDKKDGTFDWTPFEIKFDSADDATQAMFNFQLRRASGTLWIDDVELVSLGKFEPVPTF